MKKRKNSKQVPIVMILLIGVLLGFVVSGMEMIIKALAPDENYPDVRLSESPEVMSYQPSARLINQQTVGDTGISFDVPNDVNQYEDCVIFFLSDYAVSMEPGVVTMDSYIQEMGNRYFGSTSVKYKPYYSKSGYINGFHAECSLYCFSYEEHVIYTATYRLLTASDSAIFISVCGESSDYEPLIDLAYEVIATAKEIEVTDIPQTSMVLTATPSPLPAVEETPLESETGMESEEVDHTPVTYNSIGQQDFQVPENADYETMLVIFQYECSNVTPVECYMQSPDGTKTYQPVFMNVANCGEIHFEIPHPEPGTWQIHYRTNSEYLGYVYVYSYEKELYEYMQDENNKPARGYTEDELNDAGE